MILRVRFRANEKDFRSVNWPVKYPYWCSGYGENYSIVITYADDLDYIYKNWPEATDLDVQEEENITFTDRFPKPDWYIEYSGNILTVDVQEQCWKNICVENDFIEDDLKFISRLPPVGYRLVTIDEMRDYYKPQNRYDEGSVKFDVLCFNENTEKWGMSGCDEWNKGLTYCVATDIILNPRSSLSSTFVSFIDTQISEGDRFVTKKVDASVARYIKQLETFIRYPNSSKLLNVHTHLKPRE